MSDLDQLAIDTIRTLSIDAVQQANSGHSGTPMELAPSVYTMGDEVRPGGPDLADPGPVPIVSGLALSKGLGATFFIFSDYARPAIRLMELSAIFIFTHDARRTSLWNGWCRCARSRADDAAADEPPTRSVPEIPGQRPAPK